MNVFLSTRHVVFTSQVDYLELFAKNTKNLFALLFKDEVSVTPSFLLFRNFLWHNGQGAFKASFFHLLVPIPYEKIGIFLILTKAVNSKFHFFIAKYSTSNRQDHSNDPIFRFQISDLKTRKNFWKNALRRTNKKSQTSIKIKKSNKLTESENTSQTKSKAN